MTDRESSVTAYYCMKFIISSEAVKTYHEENYKLLEMSKIRGVNL